MAPNRLEHEDSLAQRLMELPDEPQPYGFAEFQRRAQRPNPRRFAGFRGFLSLSLSGLAGGALAASALVLIIVALREPPLQDGPSELANAPETPVHHPAQEHERQAVELERWLAYLPRDRALVRVGSRAAVTSLEDRIALLDDELSVERVMPGPPGRLQAIQQQRSQLLRSLVQVRYAETLAASY